MNLFQKDSQNSPNTELMSLSNLGLSRNADIASIISESCTGNLDSTDADTDADTELS